MIAEVKKQSNIMPWVLIVGAFSIGVVGAPYLKNHDLYKSAVFKIAQFLPSEITHKTVFFPEVTASVPMGDRLSTFRLKMGASVEAENFKRLSENSPIISAHLHEVLNSLRPIDTETPESWSAVITLLKQTVHDVVPGIPLEDVLILEFMME